MSNDIINAADSRTSDELANAIKTGEDIDGSLIEQLWQQVQHFAYSIAKKYSVYADMDDLLQECFLGLYDAVSGYDLNKGTFLAYAGQWFRQKCVRYIQNNGNVIRIPIFNQQRIRQYKKLIQRFQIEQNRRPTMQEICEKLNLGSVVQTEQLIRDAEMTSISSLDSPFGSADGDAVLGDFIKADGSLEDDALDREWSEQLEKVLWQQVNELPERQAAVIRMRYQEGLTLKETGEKIGITMEAVRQWQKKALRELRKPSRSRQLRPFLYDDAIYGQAIKGVGVGSFNSTWTSSTERAALSLVDPQKVYGTEARRSELPV